MVGPGEVDDELQPEIEEECEEKYGEITKVIIFEVNRATSFDWFWLNCTRSEF